MQVKVHECKRVEVITELHDIKARQLDGETKNRWINKKPYPHDAVVFVFVTHTHILYPYLGPCVKRGCCG